MQKNKAAEKAAEDVTDALGMRNAYVVLPLNLLRKQTIVPVSDFETPLNRTKFLKYVFAIVTAGYKTDEDKIAAWVHYLEDRTAGPLYTPIMSNGQMISDPYWILKHRLGQCGQINRVVVDGLAAAGYTARLVQLDGHVAAEGFFDGRWHFLDADILSFGEIVHTPTGEIPSAEKIYENPKLLNSVHPYIGFRLDPLVLNNLISLSLLDPNMKLATTSNGAPDSDKNNYKNTFKDRPTYIYKTATAQQEKDVTYGWNYYRTSDH